MRSYRAGRDLQRPQQWIAQGGQGGGVARLARRRGPARRLPGARAASAGSMAAIHGELLARVARTSPTSPARARSPARWTRCSPIHFSRAAPERASASLSSRRQGVQPAGVPLAEVVAGELQIGRPRPLGVLGDTDRAPPATPPGGAIAGPASGRSDTGPPRSAWPDGPCASRHPERRGRRRAPGPTPRAGPGRGPTSPAPPRPATPIRTRMSATCDGPGPRRTTASPSGAARPTRTAVSSIEAVSRESGGGPGPARSRPWPGRSP